MTTTRVFAWTMLAAIVAAFVAYLSLVRDGSIGPPDINAIERDVGFGTTSATAVVGVIGVAVIGCLALFAPLIYAARAHDILAVLISLALTGAAVILLLGSHTAFDRISALILYLANMIQSAAVYVAHRIAPPTS